MKATDSESLMLALRAWLDGDDERTERRRIAEYRHREGHAPVTSASSSSCIDLVDGKLRQTAEDEDLRARLRARRGP